MQKFLCLDHHTSGVRKEFYRTEEDLANMMQLMIRLPKLKKLLLENGISEEELSKLKTKLQN